ncbi:MAG: AAA family ATPase, partial [Bacillota bacterium]|nr:AAA family ATPase [Bacillota bacterium]
MRPLKLAMSAFGPYLDRQVLDFKELKDKSIFLIHGPTGSGKTTIVDAMCFALYGDTSGAEREGKEMRSHFVEPDTITEVELEFALGAEQYRIKRVPEQERAKKRGEGTTLQTAEATLWKRTGIEDKAAEGIVLAEGWRPVTEAVEGLLGFNSSQFRQVVVLPQGQFRKLLMADSREREHILEKLFQTELYSRIERFLKEEAKKLSKAIEEQRSQYEWWLSKEAQYENLNALKDGLIRHQGELREISQLFLEKQALFNKAQEDLSIGKQVKEKYLEKAAAQVELADIEAKKPLITEKTVLLTKA